jgi:N-acyl-D-aspartate/D-glutamate deacylase
MSPPLARVFAKSIGSIISASARRAAAARRPRANCPRGWVDVHTHYDGQAMRDPLLAPSCGMA